VAEHGRPEADATSTLNERLDATSGLIGLTGVQALLRGVLDQARADRARGLRTAGLITGYPGSPLGGVGDAYSARRAVFSEHDIEMVPAVNEDLAATMLWGTQLAGMDSAPRYDGVFGLWFGKGPGLDRSGDAVRHANLSGTHPHGGVVLAVGDDPFCKSSSIPCASEMALADLAVPTLCPADTQDVLRFTRVAYEVSRSCGSWIALKLHSNVADSYATVDVAAGLQVATVAEAGGQPRRAVQRYTMTAPASVEAEREAYGERPADAAAAASIMGIDTVTGDAKARLGIIAGGETSAQLRLALGDLGLGTAGDLSAAGIRVLRPGMIWPLHPGTIRRFAAGLDAILVIEEKRAFLETQVRDLLYGGPAVPHVIGKRDRQGAVLVPAYGGLRAEDITPVLRRVLEAVLGLRVSERVRLPLLPLGADLPARTSFTCSGCPHNTSTVLPEGSVGHGGIGCHGMVLRMDRGIVGITQMGGEGAQWVGASRYVTDSHRFQNMGDGTLAHSGYLAIRQAVAAGTNITFKILYNGTVAMTGGQDAPGSMPVPALSRALAAEGVARTVVVADDLRRYRWLARRALAANTRVAHRDHLDRVQRELREVPGVTCLIYDQACAAELRRARKRGRIESPRRHVLIDERICEGCGDCGRVSNCASVHPVDTELGRKTRIDLDTCNADETCLKGNCPAFLTVTEPRKRRAAEGARRAAASLPDLSGIAEPEVPESANLLLAGIGGTGVVTLNQILATAAQLDGRLATGLDQTGLAQKGGAVVSHLRVRNGDGASPSGRLTPGSADLILALDPVTAAASLDVCDAGHTAVVGTTSVVPTGAMVSGRAADPMPRLDPYRDRIEAATAPGRRLWVDASGIAAARIGTEQVANVLVLGIAFQQGWVPAPAWAIEQAIALNDASVRDNLAAFRLGRLIGAGAEPATGSVPVSGAGQAAAASPAGGPVQCGDWDVPAPLAEKITAWTDDLRDYQNARYSRQYASAVRAVRDAERSAVGNRSELTGAAALHLYRLMAYKDEYEVARLGLRSEAARSARQRFGRGASVRYQLSPPTLRMLGLHGKIGIPEWLARPAFTALRHARGVRGTIFDPFGYAADRRLERRLADEYCQLLTTLSSSLTAGNYADTVRTAGLAELIRGFDVVKRSSVERYRAELLAARDPQAGAARPAGSLQ
jgi:indolepyruvate ferredoxin oxidoreductase